MKRNTVARLTTLAVLVGSICSVNATIYPGTIEQYVADIQATRHDLNQAADVNRRYKNTHNQIAMLTDAEINEWSNAGQTMNIASRHMADLQAVTGFTPALVPQAIPTVQQLTPQPMKAPTLTPQAVPTMQQLTPQPMAVPTLTAQAIPTVQQQVPQPMKAPTLTPQAVPTVQQQTPQPNTVSAQTQHASVTVPLKTYPQTTVTTMPVQTVITGTKVTTINSQPSGTPQTGGNIQVINVVGQPGKNGTNGTNGTNSATTLTVNAWTVDTAARTQISRNNTAIYNNTTNIYQNRSAISANRSAIAANKQRIDQNSKDIHENRKTINQVGAMSQATSNLHYAGHQSGYAVAVGEYDNETAVAGGLNFGLTAKTSVSVQVSYDGNATGGSVGLSGSW